MISSTMMQLQMRLFWAGPQGHCAIRISVCCGFRASVTGTPMLQLQMNLLWAAPWPLQSSEPDASMGAFLIQDSGQSGAGFELPAGGVLLRFLGLKTEP